ncbi:MAG: radical SAM protein [Candidatus Omnitrophica bacterium]|nr:radical SAM protein [Candidatus Omnitrophota bacterium]
MEGMRIDSHKLLFHAERVSDWIKGKFVCPVCIEISPTDLCNHHCIFCGLDYGKRKGTFLDKKYVTRFVKGAAKKGLKAVIIAGEGEPLLDSNVTDFVTSFKKLKLDVAITTNGVLMDRDFCEKNLKSLTWIRVSIDAGTAPVYKRMHNASEKDFCKVLQNLNSAVSVKKKHGLKVTIGTQFLLLKENQKDLINAAKVLKKIGVDYLIVKPYSKHPLSRNEAGTDIDYSNFSYLEDRLKKYSGNGFNIIFRSATMKKRFMEKSYDRCLGVRFWAYISSDGEIYPCNTFYGVKRFSIGNVRGGSFTEIWNGEKCRTVFRHIEKKMDAKKCRELCRLDEINSYLWRIRHPHEHENFI